MSYEHILVLKTLMTEPADVGKDQASKSSKHSVHFGRMFLLKLVFVYHMVVVTFGTWEHLLTGNTRVSEITSVVSLMDLTLGLVQELHFTEQA